MTESIPPLRSLVTWVDPVNGESLIGEVVEIDPESWSLGVRDVDRGHLHRVPAKLVSRVNPPASRDA